MPTTNKRRKFHKTKKSSKQHITLHGGSVPNTYTTTNAVGTTNNSGPIPPTNAFHKKNIVDASPTTSQPTIHATTVDVNNSNTAADRLNTMAGQHLDAIHEKLKSTTGIDMRQTSLLGTLGKTTSIGLQAISHMANDAIDRHAKSYLGNVDPDMTTRDVIAKGLEKTGDIATGIVAAINTPEGKQDVQKIVSATEELNDKIIQPVTENMSETLSDLADKQSKVAGKLITNIINETPLGISINAAKIAINVGETGNNLLHAAGRLLDTAAEVKTTIAKSPHRS